MIKYKRKKYLTNRKFQIKYTLIILLAMVIMAIIIGGLTYRDISGTLGQDQAKVLMHFEIYTIRVVLVLAAAFLIGIFLSHKIIGPIGRIEKALEDINNGKYDINLKLRIGDDFSKVSEEINILAEKLKSTAEKKSQTTDTFSEK